MAANDYRPTLRPVETIVVPDTEHGRVLVLRDTQGITAQHACIPPALIPIVARFTGAATCEQIARAASGELGRVVRTVDVEQLAHELEQALFLEGPSYRAALERVAREFREAPVRPASHAGAAYAASAPELAAYIDNECLARAVAREDVSSGPRGPSITALVSPHIDPWRGARGYGHAYAALRDGLDPDADTFVLFGTSHAPMREPFALCRKGFATPLGTLNADRDAIDRLAARCSYDPFADELNHKREHALEFQVVFLRHVLGAERAQHARIVPILAGLGRQQASGADPARDPRAMELLDAVRDLIETRGRRAVVVAGADLAHVGPRFGDPLALGAELRDDLRQRDEVSLGLATGGEAHGFWKDVAGDLETRRVCGLAPIYALLRTMKGGSRGSVLHYEQTIDADDGSIVSHAAVAFRG